MKHMTLLLAAIIAVHGLHGQVVLQSDFESWTGGAPDGWSGVRTNFPAGTITQVDVDPHGGQYAVGLENATSTHRRFTTQPFASVTGTSYDITFWVRGEGEIRTGVFDNRTQNFGFAYNGYVTITGNTWTQVTQTIVIQADNPDSEFILSVRNTVAPEHLVVDDVTIELAAPPSAVSIHDIQFTGDPGGASPLVGQSVNTGGIVTARSTVEPANTGYFIQNGSGPWEGIFVSDAVNTPALGDSVALSATVQENFQMTRLVNVSAFAVVNSGNALPAAVDISSLAANDEEWEGVLIRLTSAICTDPNAGNGQWVVDDGSGAVFIDNLMHSFTPAANALYNITGLGWYSFSERKIQPRDQNDISLVNGMAGLDLSQVWVGPNPAQERFTIRTGYDSLTYTLFDNQGRQVMSGRLPGGQGEIGVSSLVSGSYLMELMSDNARGVLRVNVVH